MPVRLTRAFFARDVLEVAPDLVGKVLVRALPDGQILRARITETEAYRGEEDTACHASRGKTPRTEVLYRDAGTIYVYLIYGMHCLLNFVTAEAGIPQAVLIRATEGAPGPGRLTRALEIDRTFNRRNAVTDPALWVEDDGCIPVLRTDKRVGIDYSAPEDRDRLWRFIMQEKTGEKG